MSIAESTVNIELDDDDFYPSEDGEPMAETPIHVRAIMLLFQAFEDYLAKRLDIYIGANMFWYWEKGNLNSRRAPDIMVIKGVGRRDRKSFLGWRENGAVPCVIVEVVSSKKWRADLIKKRQLYAELGVKEYYCFDPLAEFLRPALQGFRLGPNGTHAPIDMDEEARLSCQELGLFLRAEGRTLRLIDAATGEKIMSREERADWERQQTYAERLRTEAEKARTEVERLRADSLEREVARLKAIVEKSGGAGGTT